MDVYLVDNLEKHKVNRDYFKHFYKLRWTAKILNLKLSLWNSILKIVFLC